MFVDINKKLYYHILFVFMNNAKNAYINFVSVAVPKPKINIVTDWSQLR